MICAAKTGAVKKRMKNNPELHSPCPGKKGVIDCITSLFQGKKQPVARNLICQISLRFFFEKACLLCYHSHVLGRAESYTFLPVVKSKVTGSAGVCSDMIYKTGVKQIWQKTSA